MNRQAAKAPKLLDQMREKLLVRHYAWRTEQAYLMWIVRFLRFHRDRSGGQWRHPRDRRTVRRLWSAVTRHRFLFHFGGECADEAE